jgi:transcriptional regulator with XRE-family HTH domain
MDTKPAFATPDEYADWINERIGKEVARLRGAAEISAYKLGTACGVSDQTILNLEQGNFERGVLSGTLARIAFYFGLKLKELIGAAEDKHGSAGIASPCSPSGQPSAGYLRFAPVPARNEAGK